MGQGPREGKVEGKPSPGSGSEDSTIEFYRSEAAGSLGAGAGPGRLQPRPPAPGQPGLGHR